MLNEVLKKTAWAILPDSLEQIYSILRDHNLGTLDLEAIEAKLGKNLANTRNVVIEDGIAIIPVVGPIARRMNLFHAISGGTSAEMLIKEIEKAGDDEDIDAILLSVDSPGGTVDGTKEVGDLVFETRNKKPIWTFSSGTMASGSYWIGSQAERVSVFDTTSIGSIGVVMSHYDYSKADEQAGIKRTFLTAGKYKRIVNDAEPLSEEGRNYLQEMLNDYYDLFLQAVARGRNVDKNTVLKDMADGKMFIASKALDRNMVDAIEPIEVTVKLLKEEVKERKRSKSVEEASVSINTNENEGGNIVNLAELKEKHPDLVAQIQAEVKADFKERETKLTEENNRLRADYDDLSEEVNDLKKKDVIRTQKEIKADAESVWVKALANCDIPEELHDDVKKMVSHKKFVKDGILDEEGFKTAVEAEVTDWEKKLATAYKNSVQGSSLTRRKVGEDKEDVEAEDDAWTLDMLNLAGDKKAVEKMKAN